MTIAGVSMRALTKTLSVGLLAVAAAVGSLTVPAVASTASDRDRRRPRSPRPRRQAPGSATGPTAGRFRSRAAPRTRSRSSAATTAATCGWPGTGPTRKDARPATSWPGRPPTPTRRTPTSPSTTSASASASTGTWAAPASTRTGTAPPRRPPTGAQQQAAATLAAIKGRFIPYPVIWADIELPGIAPAPDNGWNSVYTSSCSGKVKQSGVPAHVDRSELNGFADYITAHSKYKVGVYSSPAIWSTIFGTGSDSKIPNTYEWTYTAGDPEAVARAGRLVPARRPARARSSSAARPRRASTR